MTPTATDTAWAAKVDADLETIRSEVHAIKERMWRPVAVLAGSAIGVVLALGAFGLWTINRGDDVQRKNEAAIASAEVRLGAVDAQLRADFARHQQEEAQARDRLERKIDKLVDVIVEEKRPSIVRGAAP